LDGLSAKQLEQIHFGNSLLFVAVDFFVELYKKGGFSLIEHPAPAHWMPKAASIFRTALFKWLQELGPPVQRFKFNQGLHGQKGSKPTTLLLLRLETLPGLLKVRQTPAELDPERSRDKGPLVGLDEGGGFRTTEAKEYPPSMCSAISQSIHNALRASFSDKNCAETSAASDVADEREEMFPIESLRHLSVPWDPYEAAKEMGSDFMFSDAAARQHTGTGL